MIRHSKRAAVLAAVAALLVAGCRDTGEDRSVSGGTATTAAGATTQPGTESTAPASSSETTAATDESTGESTEETTGESTEDTEATESSTEETEPAAEAWTVNVDDCADPDAATAPIEGELRIGAAQPLSGTPAVAFAPVKEGFELYIEYANEQGLVPGVTLVSDIRDDQYDPTQTPGVVDSLIDDGVHIFAGIIGSPNNLAVRDTLNEECIPQLNNLTGAPDWGEVAEYPWTSGVLVPYDIEARVYAKKIHELLGDGATVGMFTVNNEFGKVFSDAFKTAAGEEGLQIIEEQTIEPTEAAPPTNQVGAIAGAAPAAIMAVPLGAQCPTFTKEVVAQKAINTGWSPLVFQTNTCGSRLLISALAAGSGDGVYTSSNLVDPVDPKFAGNPGVALFQERYTAKGLAGDLATTATGWSVGETTVNIIVKALESGTLSRQSIIEAARNLTFTPSLGRDGVQYKMNGEADGFPYQSLTVLQWHEAEGLFTEIGDLDSSYEL